MSTTNAATRPGERGEASEPAAEPAAFEARAFASSAPLSPAELLAADVRWPRPSRLQQELEASPRKLAEGLEALGLRTVGDLLEHLPRDRREARTVATLREGEQATVAVQVRSIASRPVRRRGMRPLVEATVFDASGSMRVTFFNQPWLVQRYPEGTRLLLHGKAEARGRFRVSHHAVGAELGAESDPREAEAVAHYAASEGVTSTQILTLVQGFRDALADFPEPLPASLRHVERLCDRQAALTAMHFPSSAEQAETARERLAFDELLLTQLVFLRRRAARRARTSAVSLAEPPSLIARWLEHGLPFALTADQRAAVATIGEDLAQTRSMQRLLMGEVGSGKTVVALYAMLRAVEHGHQAALMAPTETLAEQHFATLQRLLGAESLSSALLTGATPAARRADTLGKLASGELSLIVGTHALIEPSVRFRSLVVAVVDEQHRFGVRQRAALDEKGAAGTPHVLHMTATPIPRTLALARHGDLDVSTLHELPRGRQAIATRIVSGEQARAQAYVELREQLDAGRQAYVVCALVEESQAEEQNAASSPAEAPATAKQGQASPAEVRAATAEFERLAGGELSGYRLELLHGQMRAREKQAAMARFAAGAVDVLVATTVIEVGIDVPNATVMLVENAERFGISQLHQLRGRVGRGEHRSHCMLVGPPSSARLRALVAHNDGFRLAEIDLALRREGELIGTRQSGLGQFRVACLPQDTELLERARAQAQAIVGADPRLSSAEHALLGEALSGAFGTEAFEPIPA
jgi:ATP-dependent DNA helicase RecG